jgi:hypothetical protein
MRWEKMQAGKRWISAVRGGYVPTFAPFITARKEEDVEPQEEDTRREKMQAGKRWISAARGGFVLTSAPFVAARRGE